MESLTLDEEWNDGSNMFFNDNCDEQCLPKPEHLDILCKCFGHKKFRPLQWKIINSIISEKRDNCAIMSTGYGKSLCYQFPALYMGKMALIISPLISLMEDQVLAMRVSNISACLLGSANKDQSKTIDEIFQNKYSLIYLTPELCISDYGKELLQDIHAKLSISMIAVDEAHCISSWGHDFRYQYRNLGQIKDIMPGVPILAVTATATERVKEDIIKTLKLCNPQITCSGFDRPNLYFSVYLKSMNILGDLRKIMKFKDGQWKFSGPTIIYCITRKETEEISLLLKDTGIACLPYHAGLSIKVRKEAHERFLKDKIDVIVATIAFGMGIDKPDVRNIIHFGASSSIEAYYQEVGRAGRDGLPANCSAFFSNKDFDTIRFLYTRTNNNYGGNVNKDKMIDNMREYLSTIKCRREYILTYFGDKKMISNNRCCDNCSKSEPYNATYEGLDEEGRYDFTKDAVTFLKVVKALKGNFGINMYVSFLRGSTIKKLVKYIKHDLHGSGKDKNENWWKAIAILLEKEKFLEKVSNTTSTFNYFTTDVSKKGDQFLKDEDRKLVISPIPELLQCLKTKSSVWLSTTNEPQPSTSTSVKEENQDSVMILYQLLMNKRNELAASQDCMPYSIASNFALMDMAKQKPITLEQLRKCQLEGFTETKIDKFGEEFIKTIRISLNISTDQCAESRSIQDILCQYPLSETKCGTSAYTTYSLFKSGLTAQEISRKRGCSPNTVISHLIDVMKLGYPIRLTELGVTNKIKNAIEDAVQRVDTGLSLLTPIKNYCSADISYNEIKAVVAYLQIRQHLRKVNLPYIEFDDIDSLQDIPIQLHPKLEHSTSSCETGSENLQQITPTQNLTNILKAYDELDEIHTNELVREDNTNFFEEFDDAILAAACDKLESSFVKKNKVLGNDATPGEETCNTQSGFNFSVLDSPPRKQSQDKRKLEDQPKMDENKKKIKLPPWLISQRIA